MTKWILIAGGVLCGLSVVIGAFGAHALKAVLDPQALAWVKTAATYQTTHGLALLICGLLPSAKSIVRTSCLMLIGVMLFSGSLFAMALSGSTQFAIVTPVGGVFLVFAWVSFCLSVISVDKSHF